MVPTGQPACRWATTLTESWPRVRPLHPVILCGPHSAAVHGDSCAAHGGHTAWGARRMGGTPHGGHATAWGPLCPGAPPWPSDGPGPDGPDAGGFTGWNPVPNTTSMTTPPLKTTPEKFEAQLNFVRNGQRQVRPQKEAHTHPHTPTHPATSCCLASAPAVGPPAVSPPPSCCLPSQTCPLTTGQRVLRDQ